eukprot:scaffold1885_cov161-Ochromonas_danica.AAC.7
MKKYRNIFRVSRQILRQSGMKRVNVSCLVAVMAPPMPSQSVRQFHSLIRLNTELDELIRCTCSEDDDGKLDPHVDLNKH